MLRDLQKRRTVKHNAQNHWIKYKELRNKVNSEIRKAKTMFFCDKLEECAQFKDPGQSWKLINNLLGKNTKIDDDTTISDDKFLAGTFNEFCINIGTKLASEIEYESMNANSGDSVNYYRNPRQDITFNFSEIHPDEVIHQLANLKISKSTGIDNIPAKALKIAANIIGPSLAWIFNLSIKTGSESMLMNGKRLGLDQFINLSPNFDSSHH